MMILPAFILVIGLFSGWTGCGALRARRQGLGWLLLAAALLFVAVALFLFWALLRVSNIGALAP